MSQYIHGFSETEQQRLAQMQEILNLKQLDGMNFAGVTSILDVGCGQGQMTRLMARNVGETAKVVGIEKNEVQLGEASRLAAVDNESTLVDFRLGEATQLPLSSGEWSSFDMAHSRFLLEHVPDPQAVVNRMVKAIKPGGRIFLLDDDHELLRVWPDCPELDHVWRQYWESYRDFGHDPLVGRKMATMLAVAGAKVEAVSSLFYGATNGQLLFDAVVDNLVGVIVGASSLLESSNRISSDEMSRFRSAVNKWRVSPAATVWYSLPYATGIRIIE